MGRDDDFFALGGHSLQAMRVAAAAEKTNGCKVPVAVLFQARSVRDLAGWMFDSSPHGIVPLPAFAEMLLRKTSGHIRNALTSHRGTRMRYLFGRLRGLRHWISVRLGSTDTRADDAAFELPTNPDGSDYNWTIELAARHRLRPFSGSVDVFIADDADTAAISMWRWLAKGGVAFHKAPGLHMTMLDSVHAPGLAASVVAAIESRRMVP